LRLAGSLTYTAADPDQARHRWLSAVDRKNQHKTSARVRRRRAAAVRSAFLEGTLMPDRDHGLVLKSVKMASQPFARLPAELVRLSLPIK